MPPPESSVASKHRLLLELGRGGMGTVYLAVSSGPSGFSKLKVIKRLRADLASEPHFLQMFLDEARLSARLNHPNIVQTNEVGFDGQHYFLEMEYLDGQTLDALMRRATKAGGLPLPLAVWILTQVLAGLHYAHELQSLGGKPLNVVHRDVSPHNVFVTYEGVVKVLDFGIAKAADSSFDTRTGITKGKVTYMAPEQSTRAPIDRRADVFSAGVMLWQALTGQRLWSELSDAEIFLKLAERSELESPRALVPSVPEELDRLCMRALAKQREDRCATAAELQLALEDYLEKSHERPPPRALARLMNDLFAGRRDAVKKEIEAQLTRAASAEAVPSVEIPVLGHSQAYAITGSGEMSHAHTVAGAREQTRQERRIARQDSVTTALPSATWRRRFGIGSGVALTMGGAVALSIVLSRSGAPESAPPSSSTVASGARVPPECSRNAQCQPAHAICRKSDGVCVPLASADCKVFAEPGDEENDATLWVGSLFPTSGPEADAYGTESVQTAELARQEFAHIANGIPSPRGDAPSRPIALVACDDNINASRAARHLVEDLHVPAVIGFSSSQEVIDLAKSLFIPNGVLAIASLNRSSLISTIPHPKDSPRLVFRTTVSISQSAAPVSRIVSDVFEPQTRALSGVLGRSAPLKVALIRPDNTAGLSFGDAVFTHLRFNGKPALENESSFRAFAYSAAGGPDVVSAVLKFLPHVIVYIGDEGFTRSVLAPLEERWPKSAAYRPRYASNGHLMGKDFFAFIGRDADRRRRFLGISTPATVLANAKLVMRYNEKYGRKVSLTLSPGSVYDAFYVTAYAAYAAGDEPLSGKNLARAIGRLLPPGPTIDVGPASIFDAFNTLRNGGNIDLNGAATRLDFDLATGDSNADFVVLCIKPDESGMAADNVESGLVYRATTNAIEGELHCP